MITVLIVVLVVSGALMLGAGWGLWGPRNARREGFLVALAGGAVLFSAVRELIGPALEAGHFASALGGIAGGALLFAGADYLVDEHWGPQSGGGMLAAITLDGIPENLALGVVLMSAGGPEVMALAGSIFLSNLPEAASGARQMRSNGMSRARVFALWTATAALLSVAAIGGNLALRDSPGELLSLIRCLAAGAVIASLATEVFPQAYREDRHWSGVATALGLILALLLGMPAG